MTLGPNNASILARASNAYEHGQWRAASFLFGLLHRADLLAAAGSLKRIHCLLELGELDRVRVALAELQPALDPTAHELRRELQGFEGRMHKDVFLRLSELERDTPAARQGLSAASDAYRRAGGAWNVVNLHFVEALMQYYRGPSPWADEAARLALVGRIGSTADALEEDRLDPGTSTDYWDLASEATCLVLRVAATPSGEALRTPRDLAASRERLEEAPSLPAPPTARQIWSTLRTFLNIMNTLGPRPRLRPLVSIQAAQMQRWAAEGDLFELVPTRDFSIPADELTALLPGLDLVTDRLGASPTARSRKELLDRFAAVPLLRLEGGGHATAVLVGPSTILTCAHVVDLAGSLASIRVCFRTWDPPSQHYEDGVRAVVAQGRAIPYGEDWAVLELAHAVPVAVAAPIPLQAHPRPLRDDMPVVLLHYPLRPEARVSHDSYRVVEAEDGKAALCSGLCLPGSSGGALLNAELDQVVGVALGMSAWRAKGLPEGQVVDLVVPATVVREGWPQEPAAGAPIAPRDEG